MSGQCISVLSIILYPLCSSSPLESLPLPSLLTSVATIPSSTTPSGLAPLLTTMPSYSLPPSSGNGPVFASTTNASYSSLSPLLLSPGLVLSPLLEPVSQCLVRRIQSGRFFEMRELISDNIALHDKFKAIQSQISIAEIPAALRLR